MRRVRLQLKSVSSGCSVLLKSHKPRLRYERWRRHRATFIPNISTGDELPELICNCAVFIRTSCPAPTRVSSGLPPQFKSFINFFNLAFFFISGTIAEANGSRWAGAHVTWRNRALSVGLRTKTTESVPLAFWGAYSFISHGLSHGHVWCWDFNRARSHRETSTHIYLARQSERRRGRRLGGQARRRTATWSEASIERWHLDIWMTLPPRVRVRGQPSWRKDPSAAGVGSGEVRRPGLNHVSSSTNTKQAF